MKNMNVINIFKTEWIKKSARYMKDPAKMKELTEVAMNYASRKGLDEITDSVKLIGQYIKAIATGTYKDYSKSKLALSVAALVYLVVPADCVPDIIPLAGYLDDVTVITFALKQLSDELERFKVSRPINKGDNMDGMEFDEAEEIRDER